MVAILLVALALQAPPFSHSVSRVTAADLPHSWHPGCPVAPASLRRLRLTYWGFDGHAHTGALIVNVRAVAPLTRVFSRLYALRFPIRRMRPIDAYGGSDERSLAGRQHRRVQLPLRRCGRAEALVGARLRARGGRRPGREPLPRGRSRPSGRRPRVPRPLALPAGHGRSRRASRSCFCGRRLAMGRALEQLARLPALLGDRRLAHVLGGAEPAEEPLGDPAQRLLAVGVTAVQVREDRDRDALVAAGQQRDLVVDPAPARAPAALEVEPPAGRPTRAMPQRCAGVIVFSSFIA